jgi:hypothetical protein
VTKLKQPFAIRILTWFAALASAGMFLSIMLAIYDIGPHIMGGERVPRGEWLYIAAPLVTPSES